MGGPILEALGILAEALTAIRARFTLIGGAAMPAWGHDRSTRDVDVIVLVNPADEKDWIARIVETLRARGFAHMDRADRKRLDEGLLLHAWFPLRPNPVSLRVDIFLAQDPFRAEAIRRARPRKVDGFEVPVASCEDLVLLKCKAARPIDLADARALVEANTAQLDREYLGKWAEELGLTERPWEAGGKKR
ncbi:MAG: hypothetical protein HYY18_00035 [Planctomycetes bacterium]|nr:hypothetical protein [Planctomycetota bacterium]